MTMRLAMASGTEEPAAISVRLITESGILHVCPTDTHRHTHTHTYIGGLVWLAVWCSGNALVSINAVALHRARLDWDG